MADQNSVTLKYCKISSNAYSPTRGSAFAAGIDLRSIYDYVIEAHDMQIIHTGLKIQLPPSCYGRIAPRSGLAIKNMIDVGAGVIDEDFRGEIKVVLFNHSAKPFQVKKGDRIAQLICQRVHYPILMETTDLTKTGRDAKGFGSTGTN